MADMTSSFFGWEEEEEEEQRALAIDGAMGLEASSIMTGHRWANTIREFLVCWRKVWGTRAINGQRRSKRSMVFCNDDCLKEAGEK